MGKRVASSDALLVLICFIALLRLHCVEGQGSGLASLTIAPDTLKPELKDPVWDALNLAVVPLFVSLELSVVQGNVANLMGVAAYDALAVYSDKIDGFLVGGHLRRPRHERTLHNKQCAIAVAIYHTLTAAYGARAEAPLRKVLLSMKLNPNDTTVDPSTPVGVGNTVSKAVLKRFLYDELNLLGNRRDVVYNRVPLSDWTGYAPKNTAYKLKYPSRWQPLLLSVNNAYQVVQHYASPQLGRVPLMCGYKAKDFKLPIPKAIKDVKSKAYKAQTDKVLKFSAELNDTTKVLAEYIDGFFNGVGQIYLANKYNWDLDKQLIFNFAIIMAGHDSTATVTYYKTKFDTVRPVSAIRYTGIYKNIRAWGGPGKGTVTMKASEWRQYNIRTDPSPEYPSGAVAGFSTVATLAKMLLGTDEFGYSFTTPAGWSQVEPGITPKEPVTITFPTFKSMKDAAKLGRQTGGVHFQIGVDGGEILGEALGVKIYEKLTSLFNGFVF